MRGGATFLPLKIIPESPGTADVPGRPAGGVSAWRNLCVHAECGHVMWPKTDAPDDRAG
jgi:hypothetical protein